MDFVHSHETFLVNRPGCQHLFLFTCALLLCLYRIPHMQLYQYVYKYQ